jgi:formamidopyrimidine-DNA glycosylase
MTEGPEATFQANAIRRQFRGHRLRGIRILRGRYKNHGPPAGLAAFRRALPMRLTDVRKKGKVIVLDFEDGWSIIVKLGMVGWLGSTDHLHEAPPNVVFEFDGSAPLHFTDFRNFGTLTVTHDPADVDSALDAIAPDILDPATRLRDLTERIPTVKPTATIETVLMDQTALLSGIGNIIKSEVLYAARISPKRTVASLQPSDLRSIFTAARRIAARVLYILEHDIDRYDTIQKVYQRDTDPHGNPVKSHEAADGRRTFWVPAVQH